MADDSSSKGSALGCTVVGGALIALLFFLFPSEIKSYISSGGHGSIGRYQVIAVTAHEPTYPSDYRMVAFKIDTQTGKTWVYHLNADRWAVFEDDVPPPKRDAK